MIRLPKGVGYAAMRARWRTFFCVGGLHHRGLGGSRAYRRRAPGPMDVIFNPAGRVHYFRNDGAADAECMLLVGTARAEDVRFQAA
jgi:hypothetical protein